MSLDGAGLPPSLARELKEVARDAATLGEVLARPPAHPWPNEFPRDGLIEICQSLASLLQGSAEGCREPLEYARRRLPAIRHDYILSEELSARAGLASADVLRGAHLDQRLGTLISSVMTALHEYLELASEEEIVDRAGEASVVPAEATVLKADAASKKLDSELAAAEQTVKEIAQPTSAAESLKRRFRDARTLLRLARAEIRMPRVFMSWFRLTANALERYPELIQRAVAGLRAGTDVTQPLIHRLEELQHHFTGFVFVEWRRTLDVFEQVGRDLQRRRERARGIPEEPKFDLAEVRRLVLVGQAPPPSWCKLVTELDLSLSQLNSLEPLAGLVNLEKLNLDGTLISDLVPLAALTKLQTLNIRHTAVKDLSPLARSSGLQKLNLEGTQVSDLTVVAGFTDLRHLDLWHTRVTDLSPLRGLTELLSLSIGKTNVHDLSPLAGLSKLQRLDLRAAPVADIAPLTGLRSLQSLILADTQVRDVRSLSGLINLQRLYLTDTELRDLTPLSGLTRLESLHLGGTKVNDVSALAGLIYLRTLELGNLRVRGISKLAGLGSLEIERINARRNNRARSGDVNYIRKRED